MAAAGTAENLTGALSLVWTGSHEIGVWKWEIGGDERGTGRDGWLVDKSKAVRRQPDR